MTWKESFLSIFEYYTPKIVHIKNKKIGVLNRLIQFGIIVYILGYVIIYKKGYQNFSPIESTSVSKVKGIVYPNFTNEEFNPAVRKNIDLYRRTWDVADYIVPPSESNTFFVMTNVIITPNQVQGTCPEDPSIAAAICHEDKDCIPGHSVYKGNGVFTGKCHQSKLANVSSTCEIYAWCPVENDVDPLLGYKALLAGTQNFTVLVKNYVAFPLFNIKRRNIPEHGTHNLHCTYDENKNCPIFVLKNIVPGDYDHLAVKGAAIAIDIIWDCNFDYDPLDCLPTYQFRQLDSSYELAPGLNFRFAKYYSNTRRTLYKAYGIKFQIFTYGQAGKFSVVPLFLNIGSGLGLLAVTTVLCDIIVLYCIKRRDFYRNQKYQDVGNPDSRGTSVVQN